jgi:imidazoleglycerol-phosphate dehydratase
MAAPRARTAVVSRITNETTVHILLNIDGGVLPERKNVIDSLPNRKKDVLHATQASKFQTIAVDSGIGFLDHMIHALAKHAGWSLHLHCRGDLHSTITHH